MKNELFKISLVICTYNRSRYLPGSLESIKLQSYDKNLFEVIVIDNASTDDTAPIVKTFIFENPNIHISYYYEKNKGLSFARNRGIAEAKSPLIAYVDDDVILTPDYLMELMTFFDSNPAAAGAGGKVIPKYESGTEPVWMSKYLYGFVGNVNHGNEVKLFSPDMKYPAGCNMIYKKDILQKAGGFNNDLRFRSDDKYIFYKVREVSDKIFYLPDAWLYHYIDSYRLDITNFKTLFLKTGNEEKRRLISEGNTTGLFKKLFEYLFKFSASFILYFLFLFKGQPSKGKYVVISQWNTLKGFMKKDVFVR
ncbi:MAG: glycosyltransferase family 2 protein [Ginsengibacter sp.]